MIQHLNTSALVNTHVMMPGSPQETIDSAGMIVLKILRKQLLKSPRWHCSIEANGTLFSMGRHHQTLSMLSSVCVKMNRHPASCGWLGYGMVRSPASWCGNTTWTRPWGAVSIISCCALMLGWNDGNAQHTGDGYIAKNMENRGSLMLIKSVVSKADLCWTFIYIRRLDGRVMMMVEFHHQAFKLQLHPNLFTRRLNSRTA